MRQRGRKSSAELIFPVIEHRPRVDPPSSLTKAEAKSVHRIGRQRRTSEADRRPIAGQLRAGHHRVTPIARDPSKVDVWEKATRLQMSLATKLRLTAQSRTDTRTVGRQEHRGRIHGTETTGGAQG